MDRGLLDIAKWIAACSTSRSGSRPVRHHEVDRSLLDFTKWIVADRVDDMESNQSRPDIPHFPKYHTSTACSSTLLLSLLPPLSSAIHMPTSIAGRSKQVGSTLVDGLSKKLGLIRNYGAQTRQMQPTSGACVPLEERYATYIQKADSDVLANAGVNILRIPTTYAAWIELPGSALYSSNQTRYLKEISDYAIAKYNMHIIIDIHSLPGGVNG